MSHAVRPSAGDLLHQIGHYGRPSRLLIAALLLPSHFPRLLTLLLSILPVELAAWGKRQGVPARRRKSRAVAPRPA